MISISNNAMISITVTIFPLLCHLVSGQSDLHNISINPKFNHKITDWNYFKNATNIPENAQDNFNDINTTVSYSTDVLLNAVLNLIPQTNSISGNCSLVE